jgi:hypothetical protein
MSRAKNRDEFLPRFLPIAGERLIMAATFPGWRNGRSNAGSCPATIDREFIIVGHCAACERHLMGPLPMAANVQKERGSAAEMGGASPGTEGGGDARNQDNPGEGEDGRESQRATHVRKERRKGAEEN